MFTLDKRYKISLQEHILPQWWDKEAQRVIVIESGQQKQVDTRNAKRVNKFLDYADKQCTNEMLPMLAFSLKTSRKMPSLW